MESEYAYFYLTEFLKNFITFTHMWRICFRNGTNVKRQRVNGHPELMTPLMDIDRSGDHWDQIVSSPDNEGRQPGTYPRISDTRA
ncbi:hypothetical protein Trydic_g12631 [Trypoxylus dichotomus]